MKIYVNRIPVNGPYGGGNLWTRALYDNVPVLGHELVPQTDDSIVPDAILLAGLDSEGFCVSAEQAVMYKMLSKPDVKLVVRVNENDARKQTNTVDKRLIALSGHVDGTVFVSDWIRDYFVDRGWVCKNNVVIVNGVDRDVFKPAEKRANERVSIVSHHWSDNSRKGADVYEALDEFVGSPEGSSFTFTYVGRHRCHFKNTNVIRPLFGRALGEELGKHDVYVSASLQEPGANHVLESLACELPTFVHVDGGSTVEFCGRHSVFSSWKELLERLVRRDFPRVAPGIELEPWESCVKKYVSFVESL